MAESAESSSTVMDTNETSSNEEKIISQEREVSTESSELQSEENSKKKLTKAQMGKQVTIAPNVIAEVVKLERESNFSGSSSSDFFSLSFGAQRLLPNSGSKKTPPIKKAAKAKEGNVAKKDGESKKDGQTKKDDESKKDGQTKKDDESKKDGQTKKDDESKKDGQTKKDDESKKDGQTKKDDESKKDEQPNEDDGSKKDELSKEGEESKKDRKSKNDKEYRKGKKDKSSLSPSPPPSKKRYRRRSPSPRRHSRRYSRTTDDWYCDLCDALANSDATWQSHVEGKRHIRKLAAANDVGDFRYGIVPLQTPHPSEMFHRVECVNRKVVEGARATLMSKLDVIKSPCIGLKFISEVRLLDATADPIYICSLCTAFCQLTSIVSHIIGYKHRLVYTKLADPGLYEVLKQLVKKSELTGALEKEAEKMEEKDGRGEILVEEEVEGRSYDKRRGGGNRYQSSTGSYSPFQLGKLHLLPSAAKTELLKRLVYSVHPSELIGQYDVSHIQNCMRNLNTSLKSYVPTNPIPGLNEFLKSSSQDKPFQLGQPPPPPPPPPSTEYPLVSSSYPLSSAAGRGSFISSYSHPRFGAPPPPQTYSRVQYPTTHRMMGQQFY